MIGEVQAPGVVELEEGSRIIDAIEKDSFVDFEDCLQDKCAKEVGAEYIITVNEKDFVNSEIKAMNPYEFLRKLK